MCAVNVNVYMMITNGSVDIRKYVVTLVLISDEEVELEVFY
jgi:hypothetical protein